MQIEKQLPQATYWYKQGLMKIAEDQDIGIPEAAVVATADILLNAAEKQDLIPEVIAACLQLNPGQLYTQGLKGIAQVTERLQEAVEISVKQAIASKADEHIKPILRAFRYLTGKSI